MSTDRLLTLLEVADLLRVSQHTVRAWVRQGRLQSVRICRRLLFTQSEISRFVSPAIHVANPTDDKTMEYTTARLERQ
jgi:excisionase family DNA binding protein